VWFGVLGPLLVRDTGSAISVPAVRQRVLLAALLVRAGTTVSADVLAELIWDGAPPGGASATLRSHVMRLRRVLGPDAGARVVTRFPGYLVEAGQEEVDLLRFTCLCREGGAAVRADDWEQAAATLGEALGLWRGDPLADIPSELLCRAERPRLEQLRLQAVEWQTDARLHLGRHAELVPELQALAAQHRLRERFHAQLMLALVRCGRQAEALEDYQRARRVLVEELGTEPGTELRELHQRILADDPALAAPRPAPLTAGGSKSITPRELPAPVAQFAGRAGELAALTGLLDRTGAQTPEPIVISAIDGTAGVGKTALAVHWAHRVAERFPDGQLYVNLRGYDLGSPMTATDALAGLLRSLGVAGPDVPAEQAERAARYRSLLAGRRMVVVLDNASDVEQVRPLLPGYSSCAVVVTSRDSLAGLVARDGATRLDLDLLPLEDAVGLLRALIGRRVDDQPDAAATLAAQCCRLPLALRVAAELAVGRPAVPLAELTAGLADQQERLDLLDAGGDAGTAVRAVFSWSYRHLDSGAARAFRLLSLHPGADLDPYAAAALTGTGLAQARRWLGQLDRAHLIQPARPGRYSLHDLLRAYGRELAGSLDPEQERRVALTRLFDHYLYAAAVAMNALYPAEPHRRPRVPRPASPVPPLPGPAQARGWLDTERAALVAVIVHAAEHGWPGHASRFAATLVRYLDGDGHNPEALVVHAQASMAARQAGDRDAEATALNDLAAAYWRQGRYEQATSVLQQALALRSELGDRVGQARVLGNLGIMHAQQGLFEQAARLQQQVIELHRDTGNRTGEARALGNLGTVEERQGRYEQAARHHRQSLALTRELADRRGEAYALMNLGMIGLLQGRHQYALGQLQPALTLFGTVGDRNGEAEALTRIGDVCLRRGSYQEAIGHHRRALAAFREIGDRNGEAKALNGLGEALLAVGQPGEARTEQAAALGVARQIGDRFQQARAHNGLAHTWQVSGDLGRARDHWQQALALYTELGAPQAAAIRAQLTEAGYDGQAEREGFAAVVTTLRSAKNDLPGAEGDGGKGRCGERRAGVAAHHAEAAGHPVLAGVRDLLAAAPHEVPPHQQSFAERRAAEHEEPCVPAPAGRGEPDLGQAGGQVGQQPGRDERARHHRGTVHRDHGVFEVLPDTEHEVIAAGDRDLEPGQRGEHLGRGPLAAVLADDHGDPRTAFAHHGQVRVMRETRFDEPGRLGQRDPQLQAVQRGGPAGRGLLGVRDAPPGGHQVQLTGPDQLPAAEAVAVQHQPLEQPAHGLQAGMRMGWHRHARADAHVVGPVMVQEAPRAHGPQRPLRQEPADFGAVADGRLTRLEHVRGVHHGRRERDGLRGRIQVAHGPMVSFAEPHRHVSRLKSGMDHSGQIGPDGVGIHRVLQAGRERLHHPLGVVASPVEPPVHAVLHPPPDGIEQRRRHQRGGRDRHRRAEPQDLGGQQHQPGVQPDQQAGDDRVGQRPGDDPVDLIQPVLQDPLPDRHRQRGDTHPCEDAKHAQQRGAIAIARRTDGPRHAQADDGDEGATRQPFQLLTPLPVGTPPAQRLADDETQRQPEDQDQDHALDGVEPADRMIDGRQPAAFVDADGMGGQRTGDRHGGSDQQGREDNAIDAEHPAPEAREPAVGEEQDRDREHHEAGTPDLVQRQCHRG
jgi:DNA-binding SARP family transcriptional activator/tetratricopeptide (TPR) repeat protein